MKTRTRIVKFWNDKNTYLLKFFPNEIKFKLRKISDKYGKDLRGFDYLNYQWPQPAIYKDYYFFKFAKPLSVRI